MLAGLFAVFISFVVCGEEIEVVLGASSGDIIEAVLILTVGGVVITKDFKQIVLGVAEKELVIGFKNDNNIRFKPFGAVNGKPTDFLIKFLGGEDVVLDGDLF